MVTITPHNGSGPMGSREDALNAPVFRRDLPVKTRSSLEDAVLMNVVIVAKTRMFDSVCIGGIDDRTGEFIRLIPYRAGYGWSLNTELQVGDIWKLECEPIEKTVPHVEDCHVRLIERLGTMDSMRSFVTNRVDPWDGGPENLFDRRIRFSCNNRGYISERGGIPNSSVGFWITPVPLKLEEIDGKAHYRSKEGEYPLLVKYVGMGQAVDELPAGSLLRMSLARWWKPSSNPDMESRCYLQLSGWLTNESYPSRLCSEDLTRYMESEQPRDESHDPDECIEWDYYPEEEEDESSQIHNDHMVYHCKIWDVDQEDVDLSWGGTFVSGSDDPPGEVYGSDYDGVSSSEALDPWGMYSDPSEYESEED